MLNTEKKIEITTSIDYDDLSLYGINVVVDDKTGDVFIYRNNNLILSVVHNNKQIEVRQRIHGEMKLIVDEIMTKIKKYTDFLDSNKLAEVQSDIDEFFYAVICNSGTTSAEIPFYKYEVEVRKEFLNFFLKYVKLRFGEFYKEELENPFFEEIEQQLIAIELDDDKNKGIQTEIIDAQYFGFIRQKYKKFQKIK